MSKIDRSKKLQQARPPNKVQFRVVARGMKGLVHELSGDPINIKDLTSDDLEALVEAEKLLTKILGYKMHIIIERSWEEADDSDKG